MHGDSLIVGTAQSHSRTGGTILRISGTVGQTDTQHTNITLTYDPIYGHMDEHMDGQTNKQTDRQTD